MHGPFDSKGLSLLQVIRVYGSNASALS